MTRSVGLLDLATRLPALVWDAPVIVRSALTGLLVSPTSKTSIGKVFAERAARHADRVFIRFEGRDITYREANETANRYAAVLTERGVRAGDAVGIMLRNSPDTVLTMLGVVKCGAIAGMLNYNQRSDVLAHSIGLLDATVVIAEAEIAEVLGVATLDRHVGRQGDGTVGAAGDPHDVHAVGNGVGLSLGHGVADPGDELHRVQQQLLLDVRVLVVLVQFGMLRGDTAEDLLGHGSELAGFRVNEGKFPFHTKS